MYYTKLISSLEMVEKEKYWNRDGKRERKIDREIQKKINLTTSSSSNSDLCDMAMETK